MLPRDPRSPGRLTLLGCVAALGAAWVTVAVEQLVRGLIGLALGVRWLGLDLVRERGWVVAVRQGSTADLDPGSWTTMLLGTAVAMPLLALGASLAAGAVRRPWWLRSFALIWLVLASLWLPTALAAAALPEGAGPVAELYRNLGEPQAGRWAALGLALLILGLLAGPLAARAVSVGRQWVRDDSPSFRRRLVRVVAGWPVIPAVAGLLVGAGWAAPGWAAAWAIVILVTLQARTR